MDETMINGAPVSRLQDAFSKDDLIAFMKVTRLIELAPALSDAQFTVFLNSLMHYSIKVIGWAEARAALAQTAPVEEAKPVAWLHEYTEPDGDHHSMLSRSEDNPWAHWIDSYRALCVFKVTPLYATPPASREVLTLTAGQVEKVMEQAQVFASAWSLVGGVFDRGDALETAEREKVNLRKLLATAAQREGEKS
jgi:hypothetical protein